MATMFPQTLGSGPPDPFSPTPYTIPPELQAQLDAIQRRRQTPPAAIYTPEQVAQRRDENERQYALGILGTMAADQGMQGAGGQVLKQALAARQPKISERGSTDPLSGQFTYDPDYLAQREDTLEAQTQQRIAQGRQQWDMAQQAAAEKRDLWAQRAHDQQALHAMIAANAPEKGSFTPSGFMPDGTQVVTHSKTGMSYALTMGPNGQPVYTPTMGGFTPKATFEKNVATAEEAQQSAARADQLIKMVETNPDAFGLRGAAVSAAPGWAQGYAAKAAGLTSEQMGMRANMLRQAAMEINKLYGAALSAGESARAATFIPDSKDPPEQILAKLHAARDWAASSAAMQGPAANQAAQARSPGLPGAGPAPAAAAPVLDSSDPLGMRKGR